jgi:hypothetical protein
MAVHYNTTNRDTAAITKNGSSEWFNWWAQRQLQYIKCLNCQDSFTRGRCWGHINSTIQVKWRFTGRVTSVKHFHRFSGQIITDDYSEWQESNSYCKHTVLMPKLHRDKSSVYAIQMAVYCTDSQYSVSQLLKSTCPQIHCEFQELSGGGGIVALSIIATATLKERMNMNPLNTMTAHTICTAWAAWRALQERTGNIDDASGLGWSYCRDHTANPACKFEASIKISKL